MSERDVARKAEFERWQREVCNPAEAAAEPPQRIARAGETASWQIARIPSGWAFRYSAWQADGSGGSSPWRPAATREEAENRALSNVIRILSFNEGSKLLALLPSLSQGGFVLR